MKRGANGWIAILLGLVVSCGDDGGEEGSSGDPTSDGSTGSISDGSTGVPSVDFTSDIQPMLTANCTCHLQGPSGTMTAPFLTLNPEMAYDELVGPASMQAPAVQRVEPGNPDMSYLWHKLNDTQLTVGGSGTVMPQIGALPDEDLAIFEAWILGGAEP